MGAEISFAPGQPCWFELATTNQAEANSFHAQLLGWDVVEEPIGGEAVYTRFKINGGDVAAAFSLPATMLAQGTNPNWGVYFATPDVDYSTAEVTRLGGQVLHAPSEVPDAGRLSVCQDPGGATFSLWQAGRNRGVDVIEQHNSVGWTELATWDVPQAQAFYTGLLGWDTHPSSGMETLHRFAAGGSRRIFGDRPGGLTARSNVPDAAECRSYRC